MQGQFECPLISYWCNVNWTFFRMDDENPGFKFKTRLYLAPLNLALLGFQANSEGRYLQTVAGIR